MPASPQDELVPVSSSGGMSHDFAISRATQRGTLVALSFLFVYLIVVVATTPSLQPLVAIRAAFLVNWWVVAGFSIGVGIQTFLITYSKEVACNFSPRKRVATTTGILSTISSFLSYFALVPLGCCGTWLYILSFLPGFLGVGGSAFLINNSLPLVVIGFVLMAISVIYTFYSVRKRLKSSGKVERVLRPEARAS